MPTSLITKKRIAKAFKNLLKEKTFDKISIVHIMDLAQIRRQTFYNYFLDKYDLLDWIFETELREQIADNLTYISGLNLLKEVCYYFDQNRQFYQQAFQIEGQNNFYSHFFHYCQLLIQKIAREEELADSPFWVDYQSYALSGFIRQNILNSSSPLLDFYPQLRSLFVSDRQGDQHGPHL